LKRSKLPKKFSLQQPGSTFGSEFYHASELEVNSLLFSKILQFGLLIDLSKFLDVINLHKLTFRKHIIGASFY